MSLLSAVSVTECVKITSHIKQSSQAHTIKNRYKRDNSGTSCG